MAGFLFRCPECRTRRQDHGLFTQHLRKTRHSICNCGGYHYGHRKGSPYCYRNPLSAMYLAARAGEGDETLLRIAASISSESPELAAKVRDVCEFFNLKRAA